jgi:hypothetical protein
MVIKIDSDLSDNIGIKDINQLQFEETEESKRPSIIQKNIQDTKEIVDTPIKINNFEDVEKFKESYASATPTQASTKSVFNEKEEDIIETSNEVENKDIKNPYIIPTYSFEKRCNITIDDKWETVEFPSNGLYYNKNLKVRPLKVRQAAQISNAVSSGSFSAFLDVLDNNIDIPIRILTQPDFGFLLRWLKFKSYPKTPVTFTWWSKYENKNVTTITETALEFIRCDALEKHPDKVEEFKKLKMTYPRVADLEFESVAKLSDEDKWLFQYAQYFEGNTWEEKLDNLDEVTDFNAQINNLKDILHHGCNEYVYVKDTHFNASDYISSLESKLEVIRNYNEDLQKRISTNSNSIGLQSELEASYEIIGALTAELNELKSKPIESIVAEEEEKLLPFRPYVLLPDVQLESYSE